MSGIWRRNKYIYWPKWQKRDSKSQMSRRLAPKDQGSDYYVIRCWNVAWSQVHVKTRTKRRKKTLQNVSRILIEMPLFPNKYKKGRASGRTHQMRKIINKARETPKQFSALLYHIINLGKQELGQAKRGMYNSRDR